MAFLNPSILNKSEFKVTNEDNGDLAADATESSLLLTAECSANVQSVEVQNPVTKTWAKSTDLIAGGDSDCADDGKIFFSIPLSHAAPAMATEGGDFRQPFQIRWSVKNQDGEVSFYYKTLSALFRAPTVTATSGVIGPHQVSGGYTVSGTCSQTPGVIEISGVFEDVHSVSCVGGIYSATAALKSPLSSGPVTFKVKHASTASSHAYAEVQMTVNVDLDAPELHITTPVAGAVLTDLDYSTGTSFLVQGTCSEDLMPVEIKVNGVLTETFTCTVAKSFSGEVVLPEGVSTLTAYQSDAVGNESSVDITVTKDTSGPGDFTITGVQSTVDDSTIDNLLKGSILRVDFSSSADAASYDVQVRDTGGAVVCPTQNVSTGYAVFSSCILTNGISYKIFATAKDSLNRPTAALNNGFSFLVQLPMPQITSLYGDLSNVTYRAGEDIALYMQFSRPVVITGSPQMILNTGRVLSFSSSSFLAGSGNTIVKMNYVPDPGIDISPLDVTSVTLNGGTIRDQANNTNADLALPTLTANRLSARNIGIDSLNPGDVSGINITAIPARIDITPTIAFTPPADPDPLTYWLKVSRHSDGLQILGWTQVATTSTGLSLGAAVEPGVTYRVEIQVRDPYGNTSGIVSQSYISTACPTNFAYIYNPAIEADPFCVARFEAKVSAATPQFVASGDPVSANLMQAVPGCTSLGAGYSLITNSKWNAVANLIANQAGNWTNGVVGTTGLLHRGNNQVISISSVLESDPCWPISDLVLCESNGNRRKHVLPHNQSIWDFSGNAAEIVYDTDASIYNPNLDYVSTLAAGFVKTKYGTTMTCTYPTGIDHCGFGKIDLSVSASAIWRGGSSVGASESVGVFSALRSGDSATAIMGSGFRCIYEL
ncbi:MAG: hypothetical protein OM95_10260 [Bdellovibrio sp. ArHS]|nr:MAG: hypothetical protein OM95_10260 [Bdellovibrio sp. ArHS]